MRSGLVAGVFVCVAGCESPSGLEISTWLSPAPADAVPVPADYDGDGCTDIAVKGSNGVWYIDYCANGFGGAWDAAFPGYGDAGAVPVPADYDGDGLVDLAVKDATGMWAIDYAWNGFGSWDVQVFGYGNATAVPVPADYDGDGKADLAIKDATGMWGIDYAANGFHGWDVQRTGYGDSTWIPVPADYDGDGKADLAIKTATGDWYIDDSANGFGGACNFRGCTRPLWDAHFSHYGDATAVPVPADYDHDGHADLAVKDASGAWLIDLWSTGYGSWDPPVSGYQNRGGANTIAVPGNYTLDGDGRLDLAVENVTTGFWYIDKASNTLSGWDITVNNVGRPQVADPTSPYISATTLYRPDGTQPALANGQYQLTVGVRYVVEVQLQRGNGVTTADVEVNPALHVPLSLELTNPAESTYDRITEPTSRRFSITCSQIGSFPLGFQMRDAGTGNAFNPDHGVRVNCTAANGLLYGRVTRRACKASSTNVSKCGQGNNTNDVYIAGAAIPGATVTITGMTAVTADAGGNWSVANPPANTPLIVTVTAPNQSRAVAVNVIVPPGGGMEVDTPLEEAFAALVAHGMSYTTFIDYSRGRTVFHTVEIAPSVTRVRTEQPAPAIVGPPPKFDTMIGIANAIGSGAEGALAMINGGYFDEPGDVDIACPCGTGFTCNSTTNKCHWIGTGEPVGYFYSADSGGPAGGFVPSLVAQVDTLTSGAPTGVHADAPSIRAEWQRFGSGAVVAVNFAGLVGNAGDYVAIALPAAPLTSFTARSFSGGRHDGRMTFASIADGAYVGRLFTANGVLVAQTATFVVGASGSKVVVAADRRLYLPSERIAVTYSGVTPDPQTFITIVPIGSPPSTRGEVIFTGNTSAGSVIFEPVVLATYEARVVASSGALLASSDSLTSGPTIEDGNRAPLLRIVSTTVPQQVTIVHNVDANFKSGLAPWNNFAGTPIYDDVPPDGTSDLQYGLQCWPALLAGGSIMERSGTGDLAWARTSIGVSANRVFFVVADGEGVMGGQGSTLSQMGAFMRDVLHATDAMAFDGGWSSEMVLWGASGPRHVNTITGEDSRNQQDPFGGVVRESRGSFGSVDNYVKAGL